MMATNLNDPYIAWTEHRFFQYRGCAPDADNPRRAAGNPKLSLDAWLGEDRDGGEPPKERDARQQAAIEVCVDCPVMVACDRYANSVTPDGKLVEPTGIRGGRTALDRHKALIRSRHAVPVPVAAPDRLFQTKQKQDVLKALAVCWEPVEVALAAGVPDVRTANWQRSALVRLLGLPKDVSRMRVLEAAGVRGLLEGTVVVPDDGSVPAIPPNTEDLLVEMSGHVLLWPSNRSEVTAPGQRVRRGWGRGARHGSLRRKFPSVAGQLALDAAGAADAAAEDGASETDDASEAGELADVHALFPATPLEAAA